MGEAGTSDDDPAAFALQNFIRTEAVNVRGAPKPDPPLHQSDHGGQYASEQFQRLKADIGVTCSGNVWDNAAMESFFSSLKTRRVGRKTCRPRDHAMADAFDYIEPFCNPTRRHSTLGHFRPMDFQRQMHAA